MLRENVRIVEEKIRMACERSGRKRDEVTLIAVSKTKPVGMVMDAMDCGIMDFGENKVQELMTKREEVLVEPRWHFIGHLQRNKVKYVVGNVGYIHSVDSLRLAKRIEEECERRNVVQNVLIEVNVAEEDTKFGVLREDTLPLIKEISSFKHVHVKGLMTIAPYVDEPEENRMHFKALRKLLVDINKENVDNVNMNVLSMGMTGDYEVAIEEGATMVRIGTGIFGLRKNKEG